MTEPVIQVEGLSKSYRIRHQAAPGHTTLREALMTAVRAPFRRAMSPPATVEQFWALSDVCFTVRQGERVGVVGRNGAGKTTLLKLLSRITEPTRGRIRIRGRVASLLEVGTGFHGELSGRENVYLNGAVLGMSRAEIRGKFDEIVAFAEVERFLDTPIKRYSNGMAVRLAFAIAAHVEPDILVVDEVLAVGDAAFQRKCLSKMETVSAKEGRTILFVSHQMGLVTQLCSRGILLDGGRLLVDATAAEAAQAYLVLGADRIGYEHDARQSAAKEMFFTRARLLDPSGRPSNSLGFDQPLDIEIEVEVVRPSEAAQFRVILIHQTLGRVFTEVRDVRDLRSGSGRFRSRLVVPPHLIAPGHYALDLALFIHHQRYFDHQEGVSPFTIHDTGSRMALYEGQDYGTVIPPCEWHDTHVE